MSEIHTAVHVTFDALDSRTVHHDPRALADGVDLHALLARHVLGPGETPMIASAANGDGAGGAVLLPCVLRDSPGRFGAAGVRELRSLANYYLPDWRALCPASCPAPRRAGLIDAALGAALEGGAARCARFEHLDPRAPESAALEAAFVRRGWHVRTGPGSVNWTENVASGHADWLARRPSRVRNTLRRRAGRFAATVGARLEIADGRTDACGGVDPVARLVDAWQAVYARSWKVAEAYPDFVPGLIRDQAARGRLRLGIAWLDGVPIAVQLWIVRRGVAFVYKLAHDEAGARLSAGTLLFDAMARHAIERDGVGRLDFLSGDDAYKADWMGERDVKRVLLAWRPRTARGRVALARHDLGRMRDRIVSGRAPRRDRPARETNRTEST